MATQTFIALGLVKSGKRVRYISVTPAVLPLTKIAADNHP